MSIINNLKPTQRLFVMDLVREAGIDVSDWSNIKGGINRARSNPKYCYNWAFSGPGVLVLNVWFGSIEENINEILIEGNLRETSESNITKSVWKNRAGKFDNVVLNAYLNQQTIRVIINDGNERQGHSKSSQASTVKYRLLDPSPWSVSSYESDTGRFVLKRGVPPPRTIDQFDLRLEDDTSTEKNTITGEVFNRNPEVRRIALKRANGKCEFCGKEGFKTSSGEFFLETHHIIPLSKGGPDTVYNVAAICPDHHREAHYGQNALLIQDKLTNQIKNSIIQV